jgi:putative CocE/NonD family hydrolase
LTEMKTMLDVKVPMRDKVNLATNVFLPDGDGPFPVVLNRTPYLKDTSERTRRMHELVEAGYAAVTMDVRGRGNSEGEFRPVFQEIKDGFDSLEWCGTQAWSSGKVGTIGGSYEGWTQVYPMRLQSPIMPQPACSVRRPCIPSTKYGTPLACPCLS